MPKNVSGAQVRTFILRTLHIHRSSVVGKAAKRFGIPKSEVERQVTQLIAEGKLDRKAGSLEFSRARHRFQNPIAERDREDEVYKARIEPLIASLADNVRRICHYGFTEMYNNAVDHSGGTKVTVRLIISDYSVEFMIKDDGVGIFEKIKGAFGLADDRQALAALAKGGLTTDPERHSGQGIFFTSRVFDLFWILSRGSAFAHESGAEADWLLDRPHDHQGTIVLMSISKTSDRSLRGVFDAYTTDHEELAVFKTHAPFRLASLAGEDLVSRSQAKRVLSGYANYGEVLLDFAGVDFIGQAFADEVFRVFAGMNPGVELVYINANREVESMIEFAKKTVPSGPPSPP